MRRALPIALALLLTLPAAAAHIQGARPLYQGTERQRIVDLQPEGLLVRADLALSGEPLRHFVRHDLDPVHSTFSMEYRDDGSSAADAFRAVYEFGRLVEYRDTNTNGRYEPTLDTAAKVWRFTAYQWKAPLVQRVQVGDVQGWSSVWEANLTGAPDIRVEIAIAGLEFNDEGVRVRPQDVAMYLDFLDLPPRGVGHLYAMEWDVDVPAAADLDLYRVQDTPTALTAVAEQRAAIFLWGGEALIDGRETRFNATLEEERVDGRNRTAKVVLHLPTADDQLRFAIVSAVEYGIEQRRGPLGWEVALLACAIVAALTARAGRRRAE